MRKILMMGAVMMAWCAMADVSTVNGITWRYTTNDGEATVGLGVANASFTAVPTTTKGAIMIPSTLGGCPVTGISQAAFWSCKGITSITTPDSVTSIGERAFQGCCALTSITIPYGIPRIGDSAFYGCSALTGITIPDSVKSIGQSAFCECSALMSIMIPSSVTSIDSYAFMQCGNIKSVTIPGRYRFASLFDPVSTITNVTVCAGTTSISEEFCMGLSGLTSVTIPEGVTSIGARAFYGCEKLVDVTIPASVTGIGASAFQGCSVLKRVTIPEGVASIGNQAFLGCETLVDVTIPASVTGIGNYAFRNCSTLTNVNMLGTKPTGGDGIFLSVADGCTATVYNDKGWSGKEWCGLTLMYRDIIAKLDANASSDQVAAALVGSADAKLTVCITNAANYNAYCNWSKTVKNTSGTAVAGQQAVKDSPNAWVSFALGSDKLLPKPPTDEDLTVEEFEPSSEAGKFDFTVSVVGVEVGIEAQKENLKQVFGLEGATTLDPNDFSSGNVDITFGTPEGGKVKFTAGPKKNADTFFMKINVNP